MNVPTPETNAPERLWTIPNILSLGRLLMTAVIVFTIDNGYWDAAIALFIISALSDWFDGWIARTFDQATVLGRQLDPLVDKIAVIAVLIHLAALPGSGVRPWMVSVILARELIIQALRSHLESASVGFGAKMAGKLKMAFQCFAIVAVLWVFRSGGGEAVPTLKIVRDVLVWIALGLTIYSGGAYLMRARTLFDSLGKGAGG